jgi:hypothetical protein
MSIATSEGESSSEAIIGRIAMWLTTSLNSKNIGKRAIIALGVCLVFSSALAAQDRDAYGGVPPSLTLPVDTPVVGQLSQYLSSSQNRPGDGFSMTLNQPLVVNGWVVARQGQVLYGRVSVANKGGLGRGASELGIELTELTLVDGQQLPVLTQLIDATGGSNTGRNVATVATTTGLGAAIGGAVGRGRGAGIGAAAGAAAGVIGVLLTPGKPTVIEPESILTFRLGAPVTFSTDGSERAFLPVSPADYRATAARARYTPPPTRGYVRAYPRPSPYVIAPRITIVRPYRYYRAPIRIYGPRRW